MGFVVIAVLVLAVIGGSLLAAGALPGAARNLVVLGGLAAVGLVVAVASFGVLAGSPSPQASDDGEDAVDEAEPAPEDRPSSFVPLRTPTIRLVVVPADRPPSGTPAVGDLVSGSTVVVAIHAGASHAGGTLHQCPLGAAVPAECRPGLRVTTDEHGRATALVELEERLETAGGPALDCRMAGACGLVFFGPARIEVGTVFGGPAPPPVGVEAQPLRVEQGATTRAVARHLAPGASVRFSVCRWSAEDRAVSCGPATAPVRADHRGLASAPVTVDEGRCRRGVDCYLAASVAGGRPSAFGTLRVVGGPEVDYAEGRLVGGLVAGAVLLLAALWLLRRTDWTPVGGDPFRDVVVDADPFAGLVEPADQGDVAAR